MARKTKAELIEEINEILETLRNIDLEAFLEDLKSTEEEEEDWGEEEEN